MLESVKDYIEQLPDKSFDVYFMEYIMKVQDENISSELHYLQRKNQLSPIMIDQLLHDTLKEMNT